MPAAVETMMYAGEVPWHGLGVFVGKDAVTSEQAIKAAGLDWPVGLRPLYTSIGPNRLNIVTTHKAVVRETDGTNLGIVGNRYKPVQNAEAFSFFDSVVGEKLAMYHTAGALSSGTRIWILAKLPNTIAVKGKDLVEQFLLLSNTHDGSGCLRMLFTPVRVVCQNTLGMALSGGKGEGINIRHTGSIDQRIDAAKEALGFAVDYYKLFEAEANWLADTAFSDKDMVATLDVIFPAKEDGEVSKRTENTREKVLELYSGKGLGLKEWTGTAWGAYNALTEFADHHKVVRGGKDDARVASENRLESIWFGTGAQMKHKALTAIKDVVAAR